MTEGSINHSQRNLHQTDPVQIMGVPNMNKAATLQAASTAIHTLGHLLYAAQEFRKFRLTTKEELFISPCIETWMRCLSPPPTETFPPIKIVTSHSIAKTILPLSIKLDTLELLLMEPSAAHRAIIKGTADIAIVLDSPSISEGVFSTEIGKGYFQLYSLHTSPQPVPILIPDNSAETLPFLHKWRQTNSYPLNIKARFPNWALIADVCLYSNEVGLLPDFLATHTPLHPVSWQPIPSPYRLLVLHRKQNARMQQRIDTLIQAWSHLFT